LYSPSGFVAFHGAPAMTRRKVSSSFRVSGLVTIRLRFFFKPPGLATLRRCLQTVCLDPIA
jgi:hypothetical protein